MSEDGRASSDSGTSRDTRRCYAPADETQYLEARVERLRSRMAENGLDALLVTHPADRRYLSGVTAGDSQPGETPGWLLIGLSEGFGFFSSSYYEEARVTASHLEVARVQAPSAGRIAPTAAAVARHRGWKRIGFQEWALNVRWYSEFKDGLDESQTLIPTGDLMNSLRAVKDAFEITYMREAGRIASEAFSEVIAELRPGVTELRLARDLEEAIRGKGALGPSFPTIVAAGEGAAVPHHVPCERPIREGEPVIIDMGALVNGYSSDMTRTICLGQAPKRLSEMYAEVLAGLNEAVRRTYAGNRGSDVGRSGADTMGHGIGLVVHEYPFLSDDPTLEPGMVFAIEPGLYVLGWGGVRLEDTVLVGEAAGERLTTAPFVLEVGNSQ
ncbi:MAG: M24 family metallopeptidase [Bacillota bacterium]